MAARTASTLARETWAVPSRVYSTPSRVARACGWPASAGSVVETSISVTETFEQVAVGIDAPIAQERPDAAHGFAAREVDIGDEQFRLVRRRLREQFALRPGDEARSPEFDAAASVRGRLVSGAIACERWTVIQASRWRDFSAASSAGSQPMAVG